MDNVSVLWVDANGFSRLLLVHITTGSGLGSVAAAVGLGSNADWLSYWGSTPTAQTPSPTAATFQSGKDQSTLTFTDGTNLAAVTIPAPKAALFLPDMETVDPADPTGCIAALSAILTTAAGTPAPTFVSGIRGGQR